MLRLVNGLWMLLIIVLVFVALYVSLGRHYLAAVAKAPARVEQLLSSELDRSVSIEKIQSHWHFFSPSLSVHNLVLGSPQASSDLRPLQVGFLHIGVDVFRSLIARELRLSFLHMSGVKASMRLSEGRLDEIGGIGVIRALTQTDPHSIDPASSDTQPIDSTQSTSPVKDNASADAKITGNKDRLPLLARSLEHLLVDKGVILKNIEITLRSNDPTERFLVEHIALVQSAQHYQLQARVEQLGGRVIGAALNARFKGALLEPASWSGSFYLEVDRTPMAAWAERWIAPKLPKLGTLQQLDVSSALWGQFSGRALQHLTGSVALHDLLYIPQPDEPERVLNLPFAEASFRWAAQAGGRWQLRLQQLALEKEDKRVEIGPLLVFSETFPQSDASGLSGAGGRTQWRLQGENLPIGSLISLVSHSGVLPTAWSSTLEQIKPQGVIDRLEARHSGVFGEDNARWEAVAVGKDLQWQATSTTPGLTGVALKFYLDQSGGALALSVEDGELDFRPRFREKIPIGHLTVPIKLDWSEQTFEAVSGLALLKNTDAKAAALLRLNVPRTEDAPPPMLSLLATVTEGSGGVVGRYLPVGNMHPPLVRWLDQAIVSGKLPAGHFLFNGALVPDSPGGANFQMRFHTTGTTLAYHQDWPPLTEVAADVYIGEGLVHVRGESARLFDAAVSDVDVRLPPFAKGDLPVLEVKAKAKGSVTDGIRLLRETPLKANVASFIDSLTGDGQLGVDLTMALPLGGGPKGEQESTEEKPLTNEVNALGNASSLPVSKPAGAASTGEQPTQSTPSFETEVSIELHDANLMADRWQLAAQGLEGVLVYKTGEALSSAGLQGRLLDNPAVATVSSRPDNSGAMVTEVTIKGQMTAEALQNWHSLPILRFLSGSSDYQARLTLFSAQSQLLPVLNITSKLKGMAIDLPEPADKQKSEAVDFSMQWDFSSPELIAVLLKNKISFGLRRDAGVLNAVHVHFGSDRLVFPKDAGLIITGKTPALMVKPWLDFFDRYQAFEGQAVRPSSEAVADPMPEQGDFSSDNGAQSAQADRSGSWLDRLRWVDMQADSLGYVSPLVNHSTLQIARIADAWQITVQGDEVSGLISLPLIYFQPEVMQRLSTGRTTQAARALMNASPIEADIGYLALPPASKVPDLTMPAYLEGPPRSPTEAPVLERPPVSLATDEAPVSQLTTDVPLERWYRHLPPFDIVVRRVFRGTKTLGRWSMASEVVPLGFHFTRIASQFNGVNFEGTGHWQAEADGVFSELKGHARSENLAQTLSSFGYAPSIESSAADLDVSLRWAGAPWRFDVLDAQGELDMHIADGALLDVNSAASSLRVIGLLNIDMLTKRMQLDFSDVLNKGMQFKVLAGRMALKDGMLLTDSVKLRGASTQFDIAGQVNLRAKTIDQTMRVTLPVSRNLVLPAAATGGLPAATAAFVIEKALGDKLDKLTTVKFRVTGDWDDPKIVTKR